MRVRDPFVAILFTQERPPVNRGRKRVDETKRTAHVFSHAWLHISERKLCDETRRSGHVDMQHHAWLFALSLYPAVSTDAVFTVGRSWVLVAAKTLFFFYFLGNILELRYIEEWLDTRFRCRFKPGRCSRPITRVRCAEKKRRRFRLPALSILIGFGEPW